MLKKRSTLIKALMKPLNSLMSAIYSWKPLAQITLKWRLMLLLMVLVFGSTIISSIFYIQFYSTNAYRQFDEIANQSLRGVGVSIEDKLKTVNTYSKVILSNQNVQSYLKSTAHYPKLSYLSSSNQFLKEMITSFSDIDAVYLIDLQGNAASVDQLNDSTTQGTLTINQENQARWFTAIASQKGGALLRANGDDLFNQKPSKPVITLMRMVNDLDTQKPIGAMALNIDAKFISRTFQPLDMSVATTILLLDEKGEPLIPSDMAPQAIAAVRERVMVEPGKTIWTREGNKRFRESSVLIKGTQWQLISRTELRATTILRADLVALMVGAIIFNGLVILTGAIWISRSITRPVSVMAKAMSNVQGGALTKTDYSSRIPEFIKLKDVYNHMIDQIERLLQQVVAEEQTKRRAELTALQAQIKPHFLYNTFDSVSALALMGDSESVYQLVGALGQFYRLSLSSGLEVISLKEEIAIITHYLTIQKIRYRDIFELELDIAPEVEGVQVLKLILQPLVENALYHGLKPLGRMGTIRVRAWQQRTDADKATAETHKVSSFGSTTLEITIKDDGVGMTKERLEKMASFKAGEHFGLGGTRERLRLYYGYDVMTITSELELGTEIRLSLPVET